MSKRIYLLVDDGDSDAIFASYNEAEVYAHWRVLMKDDRRYIEWCIRCDYDIPQTIEDAMKSSAEIKLEVLDSFGYYIYSAVLPA